MELKFYKTNLSVYSLCVVHGEKKRRKSSQEQGCNVAKSRSKSNEKRCMNEDFSSSSLNKHVVCSTEYKVKLQI
ncbi:hypothetical protein HanXRQr2_Chr06g0250241 [Helianthus annuus]|uniref:Uncharacterized protein n=1 Tax=Helianthus annuus TaxID=4232 RepID=A0A251UGP0_HELAN|nr:hypothetical protein HanXRQr2_Chr06g0250241 [Helianthus annuus]KAJ0914696.1 hypothetical protein HanPSC8_Chr06g0241511 [Helianthus annuus]